MKDKHKFLILLFMLVMAFGYIFLRAKEPTPAFDASKVKHWQPDPAGLSGN